MDIRAAALLREGASYSTRFYKNEILEIANKRINVIDAFECLATVEGEMMMADLTEYIASFKSLYPGMRALSTFDLAKD